ncbi:MAG: EAL domain-containing protein, partial [Erysipelotrichaceae bacterium]
CGIYYLEEEDTDIREMQDKAILAQKSIKGHGVKNIAFYDASIKKNDLELKELENNMHRALENDEFKVYLQPKVNLTNGKTVGAEALIRWKTKNNLMIQPDSFIPLFEKNGFVTEIDFFVFEQVCKLLKEWISLGKTDLKIAVNLSRLHLYNLDFADRFERIRIKYSVPASYIQFELTESAVFDNLNIIKDICSRLKSLGFGIAMDDFGSGYSSLNLLSTIPVDLLKLDCKFLSDNVATKKGRIVIESIIKLASEINITVLCEGVETIEQVEFLKEVRCNLAQGYYYDKALPISEFEAKYIKD